MDDDSEDEFNVEENYYTFLNISKTSTLEEINTAYRNLSRIYHPDKHVDPGSKQKAEVLFNRTKRAYEVLSDPHMRAIYDSLGIKGLQTDGWEIIHRTKTPKEIREEYEQLARSREERRLQQRTNPRGNITVTVNATELFSPYDEIEEEPRLPRLEISGMSISQSIDAPITLKDTVSLSGNLQSSNGNGSGGLIITGRRLINRGWLELDIGAGNGPIAGVKGTKHLTDKIFCNGGASVNFRPNGMLPSFVTSLGVQLDKHTVGYLTYSGGMQSSMSSTLEQNNEKHVWSTTVLIGIPHCYISASYTRKMIEYEMKLKLTGKFGTFGFLAEYGAEKKVSKYSSVVASVSVGIPTGVILKIKVIRSSQSYVFPIHLSEEIVPAAVFYATITPVIGWLLIKNLIIDPMNEEQKKTNIDKARRNNQQRMMEKKKEAEAAVDLMKATYERIREQEETKRGLVIIKANYGNFNDDTENTKEMSIIDVTIPVQCMVKDSKLVFHNTEKSELPGFYDPSVGEDKVLCIEYSYNGSIKTVTINDKDAVRLPQAALNRRSNEASTETSSEQ